jgi:hypothetical protein
VAESNSASLRSAGAAPSRCNSESVRVPSANEVAAFVLEFMGAIYALDFSALYRRAGERMMTRMTFKSSLGSKGARSSARRERRAWIAIRRFASNR